MKFKLLIVAMCFIPAMVMAQGGTVGAGTPSSAPAAAPSDGQRQAYQALSASKPVAAPVAAKPTSAAGTYAAGVAPTPTPTKPTAAVAPDFHAQFVK